MNDSARSARRLLLVDDHPDTLAVQALILRHAGYEVHTASSSAAAWRIASEVEVDLVISDVRLGDGNGFDLLRRLHERQGLCGIALTGLAEEEAEAGRQAGCLRVLVKPVEPDDLAAAVEAAIAAGR